MKLIFITDMLSESKYKVNYVNLFSQYPKVEAFYWLTKMNTEHWEIH